jgi:hypothetical protein
MSTRTPSILISPESFWCMPPSILMSVDLPAPFSPTSPWTSPRRIENVTSCNARTPGNRLQICTISQTRSSTCPTSFLSSWIPSIAPIQYEDWAGWPRPDAPAPPFSHFHKLAFGMAPLPLGTTCRAVTTPDLCYFAMNLSTLS